MDCPTCHGSGFVYRREAQVETPVCRREIKGGCIVETTEIVVDRLGGIDACPECVAAAESTWRAVAA